MYRYNTHISPLAHPSYYTLSICELSIHVVGVVVRRSLHRNSRRLPNAYGEYPAHLPLQPFFIRRSLLTLSPYSSSHQQTPAHSHSSTRIHTTLPTCIMCAPSRENDFPAASSIKAPRDRDGRIRNHALLHDDDRQDLQTRHREHRAGAREEAHRAGRRRRQGQVHDRLCGECRE